MQSFWPKCILLISSFSLLYCGSHPKDKKTLGSSDVRPEPSDQDNPGPRKPKPAPRGEAKKDPKLIGTWVTTCIPPDENSAHHTLITQIFVGNKVTSTASLYQDDCTPQNLEIRLVFESNYSAGRASPLGQNVKLIDYRLVKATMSLHSEGEVFQSNLQNGMKGRCLRQWELGKEIEISALSTEERAKCGGKVLAPEKGKALYDIYQINGNQIRFGMAIDKQNDDGRGDRSDNRPQELSEYVYKK